MCRPSLSTFFSLCQLHVSPFFSNRCPVGWLDGWTFYGLAAFRWCWHHIKPEQELAGRGFHTKLERAPKDFTWKIDKMDQIKNNQSEICFMIGDVISVSGCFQGNAHSSFAAIASRLNCKTFFFLSIRKWWCRKVLDMLRSSCPQVNIEWY